MLCDKCKKNEATVHIKEFHNGKCTNIHLCNECANSAESSQDIPGIGFNLAEVIFNVGKLTDKLAGKNKPAAKDQTVCQVCGWTPEKIRQHDGKLGCPACYQTFDKLIKEAVSQVQHGVLHLGKRPGHTRHDSPAVKRSEIDALKKELQLLIKGEEYEAAAICRDRINALKAELESIEGASDK
ncbi:MAG: hypothetical protein E7058_07055 [Lentisphaerae bacterium]|nr:hypothetical protein [Lentisphaerota bacterium]